MVSLLLCLSANITPIITSSSSTKLTTIQQNISSSVLGINYKTDNQAAKIKELTSARGVDIVVNNTGVGSLIDDISYLVERGGTISLVGFLAGFEADWKPVQIMDLMMKGAKIKGINVGSIADFEALNRFVEDKGVRFSAVLDEVYGFGDAGKAFEHLSSGKFSGKIGIRIAA
jgi:threonine dehydrogenase-like Zn-dependent dehydrogenase